MATPVSELLCGPDQKTYEKPDPEHTFRGRLDGTRTKGNEPVYQDEDVYAFEHNVYQDREEWWEVHVVVIPKKWVPTILDITLGDAYIWNKLFGAIQKVAASLGLAEKGFIVRMGTLPPYQHTEHVHIHVLSGKHTNPKTDGPLAPVD